jgi:hypothetical protein
VLTVRFPPTGDRLQSVRRRSPVVVSRVLQALLRRRPGAASQPQQRAQGAARHGGAAVGLRPPERPRVRRLRRAGPRGLGVRPRRSEAVRGLDARSSRRATGGPPAGLERCDIVCASCHRRRTAFRAGWRRLDIDRPRRPWRSKAQERNVRYVVAALAASGCTDCGESDPCVLEHDHVGEKTQGVMQLARREVGLARLAAEMARCEVRCVNCHRRRTSVAGSHFRAQASVPPARVELALRD